LTKKVSQDNTSRRLIFVSGLSGAGKSVVLHALEDLNYYCIDNLPISLMDGLSEQIENYPEFIAIGIDARNIKDDIFSLPDCIQSLRRKGMPTELIFLDASEDILTKRFSETRRKHPLSAKDIPLHEAISLERRLLSELSESADLRIDTSHTTVHDLRRLILDRVSSRKAPVMSLLLMSFGYKFGSPRDADFIFDMRCLPNPYWDSNLRPCSGKDQAVIDFLGGQPEVARMRDHLLAFLKEWVPAFEAENRSYLTVAVGCTGGRHRSVFMVDRLEEGLRSPDKNIIVRHRDL
jgi:UPF0042 nucleotide-binding protein